MLETVLRLKQKQKQELINNQIMTPLRVSQAISALGGGGDSGVDDDINWSTCNVGCAVRGGGNVI